MPPNVVLIVFDTARADALEPYGAPVGSSPAVNDLARRGAALPDVFSTSNWTLPSHASIFTGLLPRRLGIGAARPRQVLPEHVDRILPEVLRRNGYETLGVSANVWVTKRHGFETGFDRFRGVIGDRRHAPGRGPLARLRWSWSAALARIDDGIGDARRVLSRWLAAPRTRPFFWFVNLMECHSPYLPPRPHNDLSLRDRLRAGEDARRYQSHAGFLRVSLGELEVPPESMARMRHLYARAVRSMDDLLAWLLGELDHRGLLDETLVIVTSDHGENFGEGHLLGHVVSLDDRLIRVPLVTAGPGAPRPNGEVRSLATLPRMVADAVGIGDHPWEQDACPPGLAVSHGDGLALLSPEMAEQFADRWRVQGATRERLWARRASATDGRFKLVRVDGSERLHDLHADPLEVVDALAAHPREAAKLRAALDAADEPTEAPPAGHDEALEESREIEERMRLLGYL